MKKEDKKTFGLLMAKIGEVFSIRPSAVMISIYFNHLSEFSIQQVEEAFDRAIDKLKWFPKIAEIRDLINPLGDEYVRYLERSTEENRRTFEAIEWKGLTDKKVKQMVKYICDRISEKSQLKITLEGARAEEFEEKRKIAKEKAKELIN